MSLFIQKSTPLRRWRTVSFCFSSSTAQCWDRLQPRSTWARHSDWRCSCV